MKDGLTSAAEIRRRARRTGWLVVALLLGTAAGAAVLVVRYHQDVPAVVISAMLGLPSLYQGWAAYLADQRAEESAASAALSVGGLADRLADVQAKQWMDEEVRSQFSMPYPLSVRWVPADRSLLDEWDTLMAVAGSVDPSPSADLWASSPGDLAGEGNQLAAVLARVPTRRLVVLGGAGAGKTTLMITLVLDMLKRRSPGGPVPVLVGVASWNPATNGLNEWLADRLGIDSPWLSLRASAGTGDVTNFGALISRNLIMPVLDGLDEIPDAVRGLAVAGINQAARRGESLVVTSRTESYRKAVSPPKENGEPEVRLHGAAGIELCQLDGELVGEYLRRGADGPAAKARWDPVLASLAGSGPLAKALSSPLMVGLAQVIYNPPPSVAATKPPDPRELCELPDAAAIERQLLAGFISAAYRPVRTERGLVRQRWKEQRTEDSLVFLARHLDRTIKGPDFAWWQLTSAASGVVVLTMAIAAGLACGFLGDVLGGLAIGISAGVSGGLVTIPVIGTVASIGAMAKEPPEGQRSESLTDALAPVLGPVLAIVLGGTFVAAVAVTGILVWIFVGGLVGRIAVGAAGGMVGGLAAGLVAGLKGLGEQRPPDAVRWQRRRRALGTGALFGLGVGLIGGLAVGLRPGLIFGIVGAVLAGLAAGLQGVPGDLSVAVGPDAALARARRVALVTTLAVGFPSGLLVGLAAWLAGGGDYGLLAGLVVGLMTWLICGSATTKASWLEWELARGWLALRGRLPWRLMAFLRDAHDHGVLRQSGSAYQFRHIELQRSLAAGGSKPSASKSSPGGDA